MRAALGEGQRGFQRGFQRSLQPEMLNRWAALIEGGGAERLS